MKPMVISGLHLHTCLNNKKPWRIHLKHKSKIITKALIPAFGLKQKQYLKGTIR